MTMQKTPEFHVLEALGKVATAEVVHAVALVRSEGLAFQSVFNQKADITS